MKNVSFLILALIAAATISCSSEKTGEELSTDTTSAGESLVDLVPTINTPEVANPSEIEDYIRGPKKHRITADEAKMQLRIFKIWADRINVRSGGGLIKWDDAMYGYFMDFNTLYSYIDSIKQVNDTIREDLKIDGLRLYHGAKLLRSGFMPDVFLYPTRDTFNMDPIDEDYQAFLEKFFDGQKFLNDDEFLTRLREEINNVTLTGEESGYNASFPCPQSCP